MLLHVINTGHFKLDGGAMFGVVPKSIWQKLNVPDSNNLCSWAMRCLLIEDGDRLILIDNGIGDKQDAKFMGHYYLHGNDSLDKSLQAKGFSRADITDVILTHLHFDHCGGSILRQGDKLVPAFEHAVYWSNEAHFNWATRPNDREKASFLKENILPIEASGQLQFISSPKDGSSVTPFNDKISLRFVYGHTEAMMLPQIQYKNRRLIFMADLLPAMAHIPLPYIMAYDMFPLTTLAEKKSFLAGAAENNDVLFFEHDPTIECCELMVTEKGVKAAGSFSLSEL
jgi:glyoxylase-like metal-dependent hydrolase (beta-lactamase superfamily II)